jgi:transcriptional regulator with XRE-family HTH domain
MGRIVLDLDKVVEATGKTQGEIAKEVEKDQQTLSNWKSGVPKNIEVLVRLKEVAGFKTLDELLKTVENGEA